MNNLYAIEAPEDTRTQLRRRYQQKKCLICGARDRAGRTALFCAAHLDYRYCATCMTVRTSASHGRDKSRCKTCSATRALDHYYRDPDRCLYRMRLIQMAKRSGTRGDQIMDSMRRRIALADLVRQTQGMSWPKRAALIGANACQLAYNYRTQCAGPLPDADTPDRAKRKRGAK
jgi:hypothetical protein